LVKRILHVVEECFNKVDYKNPCIHVVLVDGVEDVTIKVYNPCTTYARTYELGENSWHLLMLSWAFCFNCAFSGATFKLRAITQ